MRIRRIGLKGLLVLPERIHAREYAINRCKMLALLLVAVGVVALATPVSAVSVSRHIGVNYLSLYQEYDTPDSRLQHDFALFAKNGINTIVISLYWYRVELSEGVYDSEFINNVTRVVKIAGRFGLSVMIDFHTLMGDSDAWSNPPYVGSGMNLVTNPRIAADYVAMVTWAVTQLRCLPNIWSYSVLNEPWYWPLASLPKSNWINLIVQLARAVKAIDSRPVTVKFVGDIFERDWAWNTTLIRSLDFLSIDAYFSVNSSYWNTWSKLRAGLGDIVQHASSLGEKVQITEFGFPTSNDAVQQAVYYRYTDFFKTLANLSGWLSWGWDSSYDPNHPSWSAIGEYSIDEHSTGTPRPAFYVLCSTGLAADG